MRAPNNRASRVVGGVRWEFERAAKYWGRQWLSLRPKSTSSLSHKLEDSITVTASQPRAVAVVRARGVGVGMRTSFQHAKLLEQSAPKLIVLGQGCVSSLLPSGISFPSSTRMLGPATRHTRCL